VSSENTDAASAPLPPGHIGTSPSSPTGAPTPAPAPGKTPPGKQAPTGAVGPTGVVAPNKGQAWNETPAGSKLSGAYESMRTAFAVNMSKQRDQISTLAHRKIGG
jgi:hypothetical protein